MNTGLFCQAFDHFFPPEERLQPSPLLEQAFTRSFFDPCFLVPGFTSVKFQHALRLAYSFLPQDECYLEIGSLQGKTLISALLNNAPRKTYACDNFSEFTEDPGLSAQRLRDNLRMYGLADRVVFYDADFRNIMDREHVPEPAGLYLYDAAHTEEMQFLGIQLAEPLLADEALVIVDDWNWADVSMGTRRAFAASGNEWTSLYELTHRGESSHALWWNGTAMFRFRRRAS
jgi:hypothetical protein